MCFHLCMRTLLVTGGAGFIGSNFIDDVLSSDDDVRVVCYDKLGAGSSVKTLSVLAKWGHFTFVKGDIADEEAVERLFCSFPFDALVNFAAESHVDRSITDPLTFVRSNVMGVAVLLDACLRHGVKRFHQVSTDEVYGDTPLDSCELFSETSVLRPSSPYSASKASADLLCLSYWRTYGLDVTVTRCGNNYGRWQHYEKLIPHMIINSHLGRPLPIYGDGHNVRDWIAVGDHCRAIGLVLEKGCSGEVYNVGSDDLLSNLEVVDRILSLVGRGRELVTFVPDRPGHDRRYALDSTKLRSLGWAPQVPFDEGLASTVSFYLDNEDWWREQLP